MTREHGELVERLYAEAESLERMFPGLNAIVLRMAADRIESLSLRMRTLEDALLVIEDVWTIPAVEPPEDRKWHCQHEETLFSAAAFARAALNR